MADWLRPVFGRARVQGASNSDRPGSFSIDESIATESEDGNASFSNTPRLRPTSRVSSYIGIRPTTPPIPQTPDTFSSFRNPESVYHKPSGDQMAEMLKVVIMNQSSITPVPVEYNSCILHVLEAYQELRLELRSREEAIDGLKQTHTKAIKDFEMLASQWESKEHDYKTEMKKLEVLLSQTEGGLEKVTLARSESRVHGSKKVGDSIGRDIGTIKARSDARNSRDMSRSITTGATPAEHPGSDRYRADRFFKTRIKTNPQEISSIADKGHQIVSSQAHVLHPQESTGSFPMYSSPAEMNEPAQHNLPESDLASLTQPQLEALERQRAHEEFGVAFDSSSSDSESSTNSATKRLRQPRGLGIGIEKPLLHESKGLKPKMSRQSMNESTSSTSKYNKLSRDSPSQMGFSFRPGDDDVLAHRARTSKTTRRIPEPRVYHRKSTDTEQQSEYSSVTRDSTSDTSRHSKTEARKSASRPNLTPRTSSRRRDIQSSEPLKREDSSGSFVTALRDNSGRSSANGSQNNGQTRRRLDRNTGSSEAVTAAARALTGAPGAKRQTPQKRSGSELVDGVTKECNVQEF